MKVKFTRLLVGIGAATLAAGLGATAIGSGANAVTGPGNIDPEHPVTLTLHKYEQPAEGILGPNDGNPLTEIEGNALNGVEFTFRRIADIDLATNQGWADVANLEATTVLDPENGYTLGAPVVKQTNPQGEIVLAQPDVGIGAYVVEETASGANPIIQKAAPFIVTLPQPNQAGNGNWNYDVHVYPKNALSAITKTVDDADAFELGDAVDWTVESKVPTLAAGTSYSNYRIEDVIDERLGFQGVSATLEDGLSTTLDPGADYTLTAPATGGHGQLKIELTTVGLAKLNTATGSAKVKLAIQTKVLSIGDGTIENAATVFINNPGPGHTSEPAVTRWGALRIVKHVAGDEAKTLEGATFSLYTENPQTNTAAAPIETGIRTGTNGIAAIDGLKAGQYWLLETAAPAGYEKRVDPIVVTITAGSVAEAVRVPVPNTQVPPFTLPLTGGQGTALFVIGGSALLLTAGTAFLIARRRRTAAVIEE